MIKNPTTRPYLVSFSGIDGAGKSTQIHALRTQMESLGVSVSLVPFWDDVATLTRLRETTGHAVFKGEKGIGSPEKPVNRRDKNVQSKSMTVFRLFLYFLDALSLRRIARKAKRSHSGLIIFDRYAYDELANLNLRNPILRSYAKLIMTLVPYPDISFLLDADPVQARARKPEYPLEFLHKSRASYLELARLLGKITVIPPGTTEEVKHAVMKNALEKLSVNSDSSAPLSDATPEIDPVPRSGPLTSGKSSDYRGRCLNSRSIRSHPPGSW